MIIVEIAAGIILAVVVLASWPYILMGAAILAPILNLMRKLKEVMSWARREFGNNPSLEKHRR